MVKSFDLSWIVVSDIGKARKFFTEVVGLKEETFSDEYGWLELKGDSGATVGIAQANKEMAAGKNAIITFTVENIEKVRDEFKSKGVNLVGDIMEVPGHVKLQMFTDADGNQFQLVQVLGK